MIKITMIVQSLSLWFLLTSCSANPDPANNVVLGVAFVGVSVGSLEQSSRFYAEGAALAQLEASALDAGALPADGGKDARPLQSALLRSSNAQLWLMEFDQGERGAPVPVNGPGIAHLCFQVDQATRAYPRFLAAGAQAIGSPDMVRLNESSPVRYAYATDPDGILFEVEHVDVAALDLDTPPANDYRIRHVSLATPDIETATAFYSVLLNDPSPRRLGRFLKLSGDRLDQVSGLPGTEIEMAWFQVRNLELEIIQYHSHPTKRPTEPRPLEATGYNMIVFDVTDIIAAGERVKEAGGVLVGEPRPIRGGQIQYARDPDGNLLGLQRVSGDAVNSSMNFATNGL